MPTVDKLPEALAVIAFANISPDPKLPVVGETFPIVSVVADVVEVVVEFVGVV
jgi:hypothetical protein